MANEAQKEAARLAIYTEITRQAEALNDTVVPDKQAAALRDLSEAFANTVVPARSRAATS